MKFMRQLFAIMLAITFFTACKKNMPEEFFPANTNLVSATFLGTFTKSELNAKAVKSGYGIYSPLAKYDVDYYRIIYKTTYKEKDIRVSGLLGIPKNMSKAPSLLSAHHAEITRFADAPGNFPASFNGIEMFASAGFIEMVPDYIGLGVSSDIPQPFYHKEYSTLPVIDMIRATKYFLNRKKISYSSKFFMTGYAEGGYVTTTQSVMENDSTQRMDITASAEGGGLMVLGYIFIIYIRGQAIQAGVHISCPCWLEDFIRPMTGRVP